MILAIDHRVTWQHVTDPFYTSGKKMTALKRLLTEIGGYDIDEINKLISDLSETFADCENKSFTTEKISVAGKTVALSRDDLMILQEKLVNAKFDLQDTEKTIEHMYDGVPPSH